MLNINDKHKENLPTIRIQKVILQNFKNVKYGEITLNCGKQFIPYGTKSDILGIYGQNGSGKTSFIEALAILQNLLRGKRVPNAYAECISKECKFSQLEFMFDLQYPNGDIRKVVYEFCMTAEKLEKDELEEDSNSIEDIEELGLLNEQYKVKVFNEVLSIGGNIDGKKMKLQSVIDTSTKDIPFGPVSKKGYFIGNEDSTLFDLEINKRLAFDKSQSFIFMKDTMKIFRDKSNYSTYYRVLLELSYFSEFYLHVIDTKSSGFIRFNLGLPIYTWYGRITLKSDGPSTITEDLYKVLSDEFKKINLVLTQLVPGLTIGLKSIAPSLMKNGTKGQIVELVASRDNIELPLRDESDGIRKIISVLSLIISAYNEQSVTIAIDEFDAGIFEYLLGEILQTFEESGKGQFIFTSHNLRPLEVINKKFLYFTTTNPNNRYIQLKYVGKTNNLRNTYFREIILGEQDEEIYSKTKKHKIIAALKEAGVQG